MHTHPSYRANAMKRIVSSHGLALLFMFCAIPLSGRASAQATSPDKDAETKPLRLSTQKLAEIIKIEFSVGPEDPFSETYQRDFLSVPPSTLAAREVATPISWVVGTPTLPWPTRASTATTSLKVRPGEVLTATFTARPEPG